MCARVLVLIVTWLSPDHIAHCHYFPWPNATCSMAKKQLTRANQNICRETKLVWKVPQPLSSHMKQLRPVKVEGNGNAENSHSSAARKCDNLKGRKVRLLDQTKKKQTLCLTTFQTIHSKLMHVHKMWHYIWNDNAGYSTRYNRWDENPSRTKFSRCLAV